MSVPPSQELESALSQALARGELELFFQAKADLHNGRVAGAEALLRWRRGGTLAQPAEFIHVAERSGLIVPIGAWVIDTACARLRAWADQGFEETRVAVNVSAQQFHAGDLEAVVAGALTRHGVKPASLELELTESMLMHDPDATTVLLHRLKHLGVKLSLDDFGTGYSCFAYLCRFPIDTLKIDQSFVRDMVTQANTASIVAAIIALAHKLRLHVVAEGVENEAQLGYLRKLGCDEIQGYLFSRPLPEADYLALLAQGKAVPGQAAPENGTRTLLLVDDEPGILASLRRMLRKEGYRILTADSAAEGLALLALEDVQVVISDQRMPGMSGSEFLTRVKDMHPDCVRIILSGQADMASVLDAINNGAVYKFLTKPWDDEQLRDRIREAFRVQAALTSVNLPPP
ncbi:MAG: EAL domain-containing protein [Pseudomonadota bacterium]|nr:EAL domain-containing protein [Pseudomonadota bacterium]MDP1905725.1 EAL domain-containing protein [Pseudomonadota bacterium]MDP2353597.1 EAL domain-containing protein [Pseudomonadota bacterium]